MERFRRVVRSFFKGQLHKRYKFWGAKNGCERREAATYSSVVRRRANLRDCALDNELARPIASPPQALAHSAQIQPDRVRLFAKAKESRSRVSLQRDLGCVRGDLWDVAPISARTGLQVTGA